MTDPMVPTVDPPRGGMTRWCAWPECPRWYDAFPGPAERGWVRVGGLLICPTHRALDHLPSFRVILPDMGDAEALCSCGASQLIEAATGGKINGWWRSHVEALTPPPA